MTKKELMEQNQQLQEALWAEQAMNTSKDSKEYKEAMDLIEEFIKSHGENQTTSVFFGWLMTRPGIEKINPMLILIALGDRNSKQA